ncbi:hypothetical protein U0070_025177 [Myodes glareolus]|uniref:Uncharacterized protein n=1 Tax=Myodes glareolus TaxID=447135 RepID=A0AAW0JDS8_MYOGA
MLTSIQDLLAFMVSTEKSSLLDEGSVMTIRVIINLITEEGWKRDMNNISLPLLEIHFEVLYQFLPTLLETGSGPGGRQKSRQKDPIAEDTMQFGHRTGSTSGGYDLNVALISNSKPESKDQRFAFPRSRKIWIPQNPEYAKETSPRVIVNGFLERLRFHAMDGERDRDPQGSTGLSSQGPNEKQKEGEHEQRSQYHEGLKSSLDEINYEKLRDCWKGVLTHVTCNNRVWVNMKLLPSERRGVPESFSERQTLTQRLEAVELCSCSEQALNAGFHQHAPPVTPPTKDAKGTITVPEQVKVIAAQPDDLSLIPEIHTVMTESLTQGVAAYRMLGESFHNTLIKESPSSVKRLRGQCQLSSSKSDFPRSKDSGVGTLCELSPQSQYINKPSYYYSALSTLSSISAVFGNLCSSWLAYYFCVVQGDHDVLAILPSDPSSLRVMPRKSFSNACQKNKSMGLRSSLFLLTFKINSPFTSQLYSRLSIVTCPHFQDSEHILPTKQKEKKRRGEERRGEERRGEGRGGEGRGGEGKERRGEERRGEERRRAEERRGEERRGEARRGEARRGEASERGETAQDEGKARQGKARQGKARQDKTRQDKTRQDKKRKERKILFDQTYSDVVTWVQEGEHPNRLDPKNLVYAEETSPSVIVNGFSERLRASHIQRIRPHLENLAGSRARSVPDNWPWKLDPALPSPYFPINKSPVGVVELLLAQVNCFSGCTHRGLDLFTHILTPPTLQLDFGSSVKCSNVQEGERPNRLDPQNPAYAEETGPSVIVNGFSERPRASHSQRIRPNSENLARSRPRSVPVRLALLQIKNNSEDYFKMKLKSKENVNCSDIRRIGSCGGLKAGKAINTTAFGASSEKPKGHLSYKCHLSSILKGMEKLLWLKRKCRPLAEVTVLSLVPQRFLARAPVEVADSGLLQWLSLALACFGRGHWLRLAPVMSLALACSFGEKSDYVDDDKPRKMEWTGSLRPNVILHILLASLIYSLTNKSSTYTEGHPTSEKEKEEEEKKKKKKKRRRRRKKDDEKEEGRGRKRILTATILQLALRLLSTVISMYFLSTSFQFDQKLVINTMSTEYGTW